MAQDNNQSGAAQPATETFDKYQLNNFIFLTETLEKLGFGDIFNQELRKSMSKRDDEIDLTAKLRFKDNQEVMRFSPRFERQDGEFGDFYVLKGYKASLLKDDKEDLSQFINVFKKTGFTAEQSRNLLHGRAVRNIGRTDDGTTYPRYTKLDFEQTTESGNYRQMNKGETTLDFDLAKGLGKIPFGRNLTQQEKEDIGRQLQNGNMVPFSKRSAGNTTERMGLYTLPFEGALATVDSSGEIKKYPAPRMGGGLKQVMEPVLDQPNQQEKKGQDTPANKQLDKAAGILDKMTEGPDKGKGHGKKAA